MSGADLAAVAAQLARFLLPRRRHGGAAPQLEHALELAEALGLPRRSHAGAQQQGSAHLAGPLARSTHRLLEEALEVALEHGLQRRRCARYNNLAVSLRGATDTRTQSTYRRDALEFARRVGDRHQERRVWVGDPWARSISSVAGTKPSRARRGAASCDHIGCSKSAFSTSSDLHCERGEHRAAREVLTRNARSPSRTPGRAATARGVPGKGAARREKAA